MLTKILFLFSLVRAPLFFISKTFGNTIFFLFTPFGNAMQIAFPKTLKLFLLKNIFLYVLNRFDALILKIIFKK
jgi:hypothetical protein